MIISSAMNSAPSSSAIDAHRGQELLGRDDVAGRALHRLDDDRGDLARGRDLSACAPTSAHAMPQVGYVESERAAIAVRVRDLVRARHHRAELVLERRAHQRQRAHGLAVEAAPEAHELVLAGVALREPQRALDRLGAARVELQAVHLVRGRLCSAKRSSSSTRAARVNEPDGGLRGLLLDGVDTRGCEWPSASTLMPPMKSRNVLPSTSVTALPSAWSTTMPAISA